MRIGFDGRWYNQSGVGSYVSELLQAFDRCSDTFELVVYEDPKNPVPALRGRHISRVPLYSSRYSGAGQLEISRQCKAMKIDVFHSPYQYGAPLLLACPLIITIHDLIPFLFRTRSWPKQLVVVPWVKMGYFAAAFRARHIIADSANTARDAERILKVEPGRISTVYLAASESAFHPRGSSREAVDLFAKYNVGSPYVVVASTGNWRAKNLETALRALKLVQRRTGLDFQTVVYGPGNGIEALSRPSLTAELNIRYVGYVPVSDLAALFRNANLFITASLYEGFGLPPLEAMACGCPVVTSNGGSLAEVVGNGAQVFEPFDADGMANAVSRLLSDPDEYRYWRRRALMRASEFSWQKAAEQTLAIYRKVYGYEGKRTPSLVYDHDSEGAHL